MECGIQDNKQVLEEGAKILGVLTGQWMTNLDGIFSEWSHRVAQAAKAESEALKSMP